MTGHVIDASRDKVRAHPYLSDRIVHVAQAASHGTDARPGKEA